MEEKKEVTFDDIWQKYKTQIILTGAVIIAYRLGRKRGYDSAMSAIDHAFNKLEEVVSSAVEVGKL